MPPKYRAPSFMCSALQQSTPKLSWDKDDAERMSTMKRDFSKQEVKEMEFAEYLASSSDGEDSDEEGVEECVIRARARAPAPRRHPTLNLALALALALTLALALALAQVCLPGRASEQARKGRRPYRAGQGPSRGWRSRCRRRARRRRQGDDFRRGAEGEEGHARRRRRRAATDRL